MEREWMRYRHSTGFSHIKLLVLEMKVLENPGVIRQPIVRNGRQATVGYASEVWKTWQ